MVARIRMNADELILGIRNFLDAAKLDLSPEDHQRVITATVDHIDDLLDAQAEGMHAAHNLPAAT